MRWTVKPEWMGETAYIVGGGPSVKDIEPEVLKGRRVIAVNNAYRLFPFADICFFRDYNWYNEDGADGELHQDALERFSGRVVTTDARFKHAKGVHYLEHDKATKRRGLSANPAKLVWGTNSGHEAINLAYHMGVNLIVLIGFDMTREHGDNWHDDHKRTVEERTYKSKFRPGIESVAEILKTAGVDVFNVSPISVLECFERQPIEKVLD